MHVTWLLRACAMTRTCVWHRLIDMRDRTHSYLRHVSFICVAWLVDMCVMAQSSVCHDSSMRLIWTPYHMFTSLSCAMTRPCVICLLHSRVPGLVHASNMDSWLMYMREWTQLYVRRDSFICVAWLFHKAPKNALNSLFWDEVRPTRSKIPWNFPTVQINQYQFHLRINIKTF